MPTPATNDNTQPMIFFDLDGVLSDFDRWATEQGKLKPNGAVNWNALDYNWWVTMPPTPGAKDAYDTAWKLGRVMFLTAASLDSGSFSGKVDWVKKFVPEAGSRIVETLVIAPSADKALLAAPNRILIDDRQSNIDAWNAAGGMGIHHTGDFKQTLAELQAAVAKIKAAAPNAAPATPPVQPTVTPPAKIVGKFNAALKM